MFNLFGRVRERTSARQRLFAELPYAPPPANLAIGSTTDQPQDGGCGDEGGVEGGGQGVGLTRGAPQSRETRGKSGRERSSQESSAGSAGRIGAAISALAAGEVADHFGYTVSFLALGVAALVAFLVFLIWMPETRGQETLPPIDGATAFEAAPGE